MAQLLCPSIPMYPPSTMSCDNLFTPDDQPSPAAPSSDSEEPRTKKRRKQSNPVRIQTTGQPEENGPPPVSDASKLDESPYKCPHCLLLFPNDHVLQFHIEDEHSSKLLDPQILQRSSVKSTSSCSDKENVDVSRISKSSEGSPIAASSPPILLSQELKDPRHQPLHFPSIPSLISYSQSGDIKPGNAPLSMFSGPMSPFLFPVISQGQTPPLLNGGAMPSGGMRIFNMEAYCELCNKEFCNKYFLKTHKANKHGIYTMDTLVSSSYPSPYLSPSIPTSIPLPPLIPTSSSTIGIGEPPPLHLSSRIPGLFSLDSYCELCQKEFCNKYFLKKHRKKIHGIGTSENSRASSPIITSSSSMDLKDTSPITIPSYQPMCSTIATTSEKPPPPPSSLPQEEPLMLDFSMPHSSKVNNIPTTCGATTPILNSLVSENLSSQISSSSSSSCGEVHSSLFTPEKLREIGVINADAFCEICCKEFCNKYFLRTHKINKHGMNIPEYSNKPSNNGSHSLQSNSSSEKNDDSCGPKQYSDDRLVPYSEDSIKRLSTEVCCDICTRPFASNYLLKMHKFYSHNIPYIKEEDYQKASSPPENLSMPQTSSEHRIPESMFGCSTPLSYNANASQDLLKLQTMIRELNSSVSPDTGKVGCNLCQAEFENKYFLRAHMMNEHGVLPSEEGSIMMEKACENQPLDLQKHPTSLNNSSFDAESFCEICQKDFCSKYFLKTHKQNVHGIPQDLSPASRRSLSLVEDLLHTPAPCLLPPNLSLFENKPLMNRNYCNICNKELCNKYFMKTHMLKMHGINIDTRASDGSKTTVIGGVTCDICQKELCSKYFLKVHKQNTHGIMDEQTPAKDSSGNPSFIEPSENNSEDRHVSELCPFCGRRFKSGKWLKAHIMSDHPSSMPKENSSFLPPESSLDVPENCIICNHTYPDKVALQVHMIKDHSSASEELSMASSNPFREHPKLNGNSLPQSPNSQQHHQQQQAQLSPKPSSGTSRIYNCSFCIYSTRWLSNLYAHEKRHTGPYPPQEADKRFACRICHRAYRYNHSLQRHLLSHRPTSSGGLPTAKRYRCSKCNRKFKTKDACILHIRLVHQKKGGGGASFRCRTCGFATRSPHVLRSHIRGHSQSPQLPTTFAMPQNPPSAGTFIMQPFLVAEPEHDHEHEPPLAAAPPAPTFVPSLVYLPVCQKILQPVTVAFSLTPA